MSVTVDLEWNLKQLLSAKLLDARPFSLLAGNGVVLFYIVSTTSNFDRRKVTSEEFLDAVAVGVDKG